MHLLLFIETSRPIRFGIEIAQPKRFQMLLFLLMRFEYKPMQ